jgi:large subunit ribosomal protein L20
MARTKGGPSSIAWHKKVIKRAKGFRGRANSCYKVALLKTEKAMQYATRDRRAKKRSFRSLWIQRINAAVREHGMTYSQFMHGVQLAGIELDRKVMADVAMNDNASFEAIFKTVKAALDKANKAA